ncbi:hypothetical protein J6590_052302 [Homalodisca vitripennis]|nr:hypothetical protein J6590_052302 [Homalodisca vitripennis]
MCPDIADLCDERTAGLAAILDAVQAPSTRAVVGSVDPGLCALVEALTYVRQTPFVTWSCPQVILT